MNKKRNILRNLELAIFRILIFEKYQLLGKIVFFQAKYITEAEDKYDSLMKTLEPQLSLKYQRRCEEATKEGNFLKFKLNNRNASDILKYFAMWLICTSWNSRWEDVWTSSWDMEYTTCNCRWGILPIQLVKQLVNLRALVLKLLVRIYLHLGSHLIAAWQTESLMLHVSLLWSNRFHYQLCHVRDWDLCLNIR